MTDHNPDKLTPNQILEKVYIYLAHAQAEPKTITPEEHRAMLAAVFPAFSELYLDGASLTPVAKRSAFQR